MLPCAVQYFPVLCREGRDLALLTDDGELAAVFRPAFGLRIRIALPDRLQDRLRRHAGLEQCDGLRAVAHVHDGL
jgi:hypothetical protein